MLEVRVLNFLSGLPLTVFIPLAVDTQFSKDAPQDMFAPIVAKTPSLVKSKNSGRPGAFRSKTLITHDEFCEYFTVVMAFAVCS